MAPMKFGGRVTVLGEARGLLSEGSKPARMRIIACREEELGVAFAWNCVKINFEIYIKHSQLVIKRCLTIL